MNRYGLIAAFALASATSAAAQDTAKVNGPIDVQPRTQQGNVSTVNGSIRIGEGATIGTATSVNGAIELGADATAAGIRTVNGRLTLGSSATVASLTTVNGSILLEENAKVSSGVQGVNSRITLNRLADVRGRLMNVNGSIHLQEAHVGAGIETVSGDIEIGAGSRVEGGVRVRKASCYTDSFPEWFWNWFPRSWFSNCGQRISQVVIGPDAVVQGILKFEHPVKLYVSKRARIGPVEGAQVIVYPGDRPL